MRDDPLSVLAPPSVAMSAESATDFTYATGRDDALDIGRSGWRRTLAPFALQTVPTPDDDEEDDEDDDAGGDDGNIEPDDDEGYDDEDEDEDDEEPWQVRTALRVAGCR